MEFSNVTFASDDERNLKHAKVFLNENLFHYYHNNRGFCSFRDNCRYQNQEMQIHAVNFLTTKIIQKLSEQGSWTTSTLLALLSRSLSFSYCPFESKVDICWCKISSYHNGTMAHLPYIITKLVRIIDDLCVGHF